MIQLFIESMLVVAMLSNTAMAIDIYVPEKKQQTTPAHIQDNKPSAIEGESTCNRATTVRGNRGVTLCAHLKSGKSGTTAAFDDADVRKTPFLQIIN
jgi:hypothetical protein